MIEYENDFDRSFAEQMLSPQRYQSVFIDVDSCLCGIEGIDLLGSIHGKTDEIAELTNDAMNGTVPIEQVFEKRLNLIKPVPHDLMDVANAYLGTITPYATETIDALQTLGIDVHLLSGGYDGAILPLAKHLGISPKNVHANKLYFDYEGNYAGFDKSNHLWQKGGKRMVIEDLKRSGDIWGLSAIIGDAISEVETKPVTDFRIGFGGHVRREVVEKSADVFVEAMSFAPLLPLLIDTIAIDHILLFRPDKRQILRKGFEGLSQVRFNNNTRYLGNVLRNTYAGIPQEMFDPNIPAIKENDG